MVAELSPPHQYQGQPKLYRRVVRTTVGRAEAGFRLEVVALSDAPPMCVTLHLGANSSYAMATQADPATGVAYSQVYLAVAPLPLGDQFSYWVSAECITEWASGAVLRSLAFANQTVVVI